MAEKGPDVPTLPGAPYGYNGKFVHSSLGTLFVCVGAIQRNVSINTAEDSASQAKTMYPLWVSQGSTSLRLLHRDHAAREQVSAWLRNFMELASSDRLDEAFMDVSVPVRNFHRRVVPEGTLVYGARFDDGMLTTMINLTGAADPVRRTRERSRMQTAPNDPVASYFYPAGIQAGYNPADAIYDVPGPIRPGMPREAI